MDKQLILVGVRGKHTQILFGPAQPQAVGTEKSKLARSGNWKNWVFEIRTPAGYANKKILNPKHD